MLGEAFQGNIGSAFEIFLKWLIRFKFFQDGYSSLILYLLVISFELSICYVCVKGRIFSWTHRFTYVWLCLLL